MNANHFELARSRRIDSLNVEVQEYRHRGTGALHYHLAAEDRNNCFVVAFPTVPRDSTGVAHILEHTVLCGSRRYPVRDPFFMMLRRSLNTFMNAFTTSDATAYPFATQNRKDFDNLLSVYLDAVFFPRLDELDFAQEGHRLEFARPDDPSSRLTYRGVVYNEMKGAMSAPAAQLQQELQSLLFPTTTYHYNSGGDPERIPDLSHEQLRAFHASHYHPSNATFMTYGDFSPQEHQARFEQWALRHFKTQAFDLNLHDERRYTQPLHVQGAYTYDDPDDLRDRTYVAIGWLLGKVGDTKQLMRDHLLTNVLLQHSASPLRHALETTPLGTAPLEFCGLDDANREAVFICGLEGSNPEHGDAVEALVFDVLGRVAHDGVPHEALEAVLGQMEMVQREMSSGHFPYGLQLLSRVLGAKVHDGDPFAYLDIDPAIEELRRDIEDPGFIKGLLRRLIENPHRVRLVMSPDASLAGRREQTERQRLEAVKASLGAEATARIVERARTLDHRQRHGNDPSLLPKVELKDVPPDLNIPVGREEAINDVPVTWYAAGTNGLVHEQIVIDLPELTAGETEALVLYYSMLTEVGVGAMDYLAAQQAQVRIGAFSAYTSVRGGVDDPGTVRGFLALAGKSLARHQAMLSHAMREIVERARFDELPRLRDLVAQMRAAQESSVTDRGHSLALLVAGSGMNPCGYLDDLWDGPASILRLKALDESLEDAGHLQAFAATLRGMHEKVLRQPRRLLVISQARHQAEIGTALAQQWTAPPVTVPRPFSWTPVSARVNEAWVTNTQVSFCARAYPAVPPEHPDAPVFSVLGKFLHHGYLHRAIREQGGAYGSGASYDADSASFRFYSYRDPRLEGTLNDFDRALEWLQGAHGFTELEEAILGVIQIIDQPLSPAREVIQAHFHLLQGRTPAFRRRFRERALKVTIADLQRVGRTYLQPARASTGVISNREILDRHRHLGFDVKVL